MRRFCRQPRPPRSSVPSGRGIFKAWVVDISALLVAFGCNALPRAAQHPRRSTVPLAPHFAAKPPPAPEFADPTRQQKLGALVEALNAKIDAFFQSEKPPSLAVAFVADGEVRLTRVLGMANEADKVAADSRTLYRIGSVTKTLTASLVVALRDAGQLELDDPAEAYLPELSLVEYPFEDSTRLTLRHLLSHTSGLPRLGNFDYTKPDANITDAVLLRAVSEARLGAVPGTEYLYSNLGMAIAGLIAARCSSEGSLRAALANHVTHPLGMTSTVFEASLAPHAVAATGYVDRQGSAVTASWHLGASEAAGGLWSSLDDMSRWVLFQLAAWPPRSGPELGPIRRATLCEQHTATFLIGLTAESSKASLRATASAVGLGWHTHKECDYEHIVEQGGSMDGFKANVAFAPDRAFGIVILSNSSNTSTTALQTDLLAMIGPALSARKAVPARDTAALLSDLGASFETCPKSAYDELLTQGFRAALARAQHAAICARFSKRHGRCTLDKVLSLTTPDQGDFLMTCERGAVHASANVVREDGKARFSGLQIHSTGFPVSPAMLQGADRVLSMLERWDEQSSTTIFANLSTRDAARAALAHLKEDFGRCRLSADAPTGLYSDGEQVVYLPLDCDRGKPVKLRINLEASGKINGFFFTPLNSGNLISHCSQPKP
jgi:CubicO group peptidase (beta-lactamase class C family)